jgi:hypothetical protein
MMMMDLMEMNDDDDDDDINVNTSTITSTITSTNTIESISRNTSKNSIDNMQQEECCIICFDKIEPIDYISSDHGLIKHSQGYHRECWNIYIKKFDTCPLCRMTLIIHDDENQAPFNNHTNFILRPHEVHIMENRMNIFYINLEALIFISTLGHTISIKINDDLFSHILKLCISFYIAGVVFKRYIRLVAVSPFHYMFLYYMSYILVCSVLNKYCIVMNEIIDEQY